MPGEGDTILSEEDRTPPQHPNLRPGKGPPEVPSSTRDPRGEGAGGAGLEQGPRTLHLQDAHPRGQATLDGHGRGLGWGRAGAVGCRRGVTPPVAVRAVAGC